MQVKIKTLFPMWLSLTLLPCGSNSLNQTVLLNFAQVCLSSLLALHTQGGGRFTILPTISVVAPWDDPVQHPAHLDPVHHHHHNSLARDQALSDSNAVLRVVSPSPVLPPQPPPFSTSTSRPAWVEEAALNATHRFYNVLRAVLHGGEEHEEAGPSLRWVRSLSEAHRG